MRSKMTHFRATIITVLLLALSPGIVLAQSGSGASGSGASFSIPTGGGPPPPTPPCITSPAPANDVQGNQYTATFVAGCSTALPITWTTTPTNPVPGLGTITSTDQVTAILTGVLGAPGSYGFNVTATDANHQVATAAYTIQIAPATPPNIDSAPPPAGLVGVAYGSGGAGFTPHATGSHPPFTWTLTPGSSALPGGLTGPNLTTGLISGTPTTVGTFTGIRLRVTDALGSTFDVPAPGYTIAVSFPQPCITSSFPPSGTTLTPYTFTFTAGCTTGGYTWSSTGNLPAGTSLNATTGVLSGTLGTPGIYTFTIIAKDLNNQTASNIYTVTIQSLATGNIAALPIEWADNHECDGTATAHAVTLGTLTLAGLQAVINAANTQRDADGTGTTITIPAGTVMAGTASINLPGPGTATGLASKNCIVVTSSTPVTPDTMVCSHGPWEGNRNPGCTNDIAKLWTISQTNPATPAMTCNPGASGSSRYYYISNGEIRDDSSGTVGGSNGIALVNCGTQAEVTEAAQPQHITFAQNYLHGYDSPNISTGRAFFYSMNHSSIVYNYTEMIHFEGKEGQCISTQQSGVMKINHNWVEGCSEGIFIGGADPAIPGYNSHDFEIRGNMVTLDPSWVTQSSVSVTPRPHAWNIKNRIEFKRVVRVLADGNELAQSWGDAQSGFLLLVNIRACSVVGCTGGNQSIITDVTFSNNVLMHAAAAMQTDAASGGSGNGNGQSLKGTRWNFSNIFMGDIGDNTRYPQSCPQTGCLHTPPYNAYTAVGMQVGTSGQAIQCNLSRNGAGTIATAVCSSSQTNVPGTGISPGDPIALSACVGDSAFNVGTSAVGPLEITGAPNSMTFTFANNGPPNGTATACNLDNSVGSPNYFTMNHFTMIASGAAQSAFWAVTEGNSPKFQYPRNFLFTNSIVASNGGNPGGISGGGKTEGTAVEQLFDINTAQFNSNVLTGRKSSLYTTYQNGQKANAFPGNGVGGAANQTGVVCPTSTPTSGCVGFTALMNGVAFDVSHSDWHNYGLRPDSFFAAGNAGQASDNTDMGADLGAIQRAIVSPLYTCQTPCGSGPFPDTGAVFMVPSGGDNVHGCTRTQPCDTWAAVKTALQSLPFGDRAAFLRAGIYRTTSTVNFTSSDSSPPQEDMMDWWCTPFPTRTTNHLNGVGTNSYCWMDADGRKFWLMKASAGNPWDINLYDLKYIYFWLTENNDICLFTDGHCWKRKITPTPLSPRFVTLGQDYIIETKGPSGASNPGAPTGNCGLDNLPTTFLGDVRGDTYGPQTINWGGSVGSQPTYIVDYYYSGNNGSYHSLERYSLVKGFGWVQWQLLSCSGTCIPGIAGVGGATYTVSQTVLKNNLVAGGAPTPNFPCGTNFPWWEGGTTIGAGGNVAAPSGTPPADQTLYNNFPGESVEVTGNKKITGLANIGACGANCVEYTVTQPAASWFNYENLYYNGKRRPRPTYAGATPLHNYAPNACPTTTNDDAFLCVSGGGGHTQAQADIDCGCSATVTAGGGHCANTQTKICTQVASGGTTPFQCFNKYKTLAGDLSNAWHGVNVGDVEIDVFESWTMAKMRLSSVPGAGQAIFSGATAQTNDHGCQGTHQYLVENVKPSDVALNPKGMWYLDRCPTNSCGGTTIPWAPVYEANWVLHVYADTSISENPLTADIEVPQLDPANPRVFSGTSVNNLSFQDLIVSGDNWQVPNIGLGDQQGQPSVTSLMSFTDSSYLKFDSMQIQHTAGGGMTFQGTSTHNTIQNSYLGDIGGLSIRFGTSVSGKMQAQAGDTDLNVPQFNTVQNNLFDSPQRVHPTGYGGAVFIGDGHDNTITHNEVQNPYTGCFEVGFGLARGTGTQYFIYNNIVSYNLCLGAPNALMSDFGLIYHAPSLSSKCPAGTPLTGNPCNQTVHNVFKNAYNNYDISSSSTSSGGRCIYADQGSSNLLIQYNLAVRCGHSALYMNQPENTATDPMHWAAQNNLIDNNILAYCGYINGTFTALLPTGCIAKTGQNKNAFTYSHNLAYFNIVLSTNHFQNLAGQWLCFDNNGVNLLTTEIPCTGLWTLANNVYWNKAAGNILAFATCKINTCPAPVNGTNFNLYLGVTPGQINNGWTNPFQLDGSGHQIAAGEDANSIGQDPGFVNPTYPTDDYHYSRDYSGIGITVFDYTQAGRLPGSPWSLQGVPELFPVRPVNPATDF